MWEPEALELKTLDQHDRAHAEVAQGTQADPCKYDEGLCPRLIDWLYFKVCST